MSSLMFTLKNSKLFKSIINFLLKSNAINFPVYTGRRTEYSLIELP